MMRLTWIVIIQLQLLLFLLLYDVKTNNFAVRHEKTQISLGISSVYIFFFYQRASYEEHLTPNALK